MPNLFLFIKSLINLSRNQKRNWFDGKRRKYIKYIGKAETENIDLAKKNKWYQRADSCLNRIKTYDTVLKNEEKQSFTQSKNIVKTDDTLELEILADDNSTAAEVLMTLDDEQTESTDSSRRIIQMLVAVIRNVIFKHHNSTITEANITELLPDATGVEIRTFLIISNCIMPYVPSKENWFKLAYQLPLILMANDILYISGYSKFSASISPLTMPAELNDLSVDAPSLFSLFSSQKIKSKDARLDIYDFSNRKIVSKEIATENKDAIFSSFFGY